MKLNKRYQIFIQFILFGFMSCTIDNSIKFECEKSSSICTVNNVTIDANPIVTSNNFGLYYDFGSYQYETPKDKENHIIFSNSTLYDIPQNVFTYFKVLSFKAENSSLPKINSTIFGFSNIQNLRHLQSIQLSYNKITVLEHMVFSGAAELQTIDLSHNTISSIKETAFYGLKKLTKLDLSYNAIANLEPGQLAELVLLDTILLSHNKFELLPSKLFEHNSALKTVCLNNNELKSLDSAAALKLDLIDLTNNQLVSFDFVNIEATEQHFSNNFLETVVIGESVEVFELSNNSVINILVNDANQLKNLSLRSNNISDISFLVQAQNLQTLDLSLNRGIQIDLHSFAYLQNLTSLKLNSIDLTLIDYGLFAHLSNLTALEIAGNALQTLDLNKMIGLNKLESLFINDNNLTDFDYADMKSVLPSLLKVRIYKNSWNCSFLSAMTKVLTAQNIYIETPTDVLIRNSSNVNGIACERLNWVNNSQTKLPGSDQNTNELSSKINDLMQNMVKIKEAFSNNQMYVENRFLSLESSIINIKQMLQTTISNTSQLNITTQMYQLMEGWNNLTLQRQQANHEVLQQISYLTKQSGENAGAIVKTENLQETSSSGFDRSLVIALMLINVAVITIFAVVKIFDCIKKRTIIANQFQHNTRKMQFENKTVFENSL